MKKKQNQFLKKLMASTLGLVLLFSVLTPVGVKATSTQPIESGSSQKLNTDEDSAFVLANSNVQISDDYDPETASNDGMETNGAPAVGSVSATVGDPMVYWTQKWLNQTYGSVNGFGSVTVDGQTGSGTVNGLLRALQIELGISPPVNSFGDATSTLYAADPLHKQSGTNRKFAILQGALWCKGYNPGYHLSEDKNGIVTFNGVFDAGVEIAVKQLKTDAGFVSPDDVVTLNVMKALLSMDSFKLLPSYGGKAEIRAMQQKLNRKYEAYTGLTPCDGVYGRNTNRALIYALQAEEGLPVGTANGNFGNTTKLCCPEIPYNKDDSGAAKDFSGAFYTDTQISSFTELLQFALYVNGFGNGTVDGVFSANTEQLLRAFQKQYAIPETGKADLGTWLSLFLSCGDIDRAATAADCATILTAAKAQTLFDNGYRYIGRYLTGTYGGGISKALTESEAQIIFDAGLRFFPIYQTSATSNAYFTQAQGTADAAAAVAAAASLGVPPNTIIYFAVDFDALDSQVTSNIIPYFQKVYEAMSGGLYKTGIYGTRNVCSRVSALGYACSSFVGDMSTGFSGNLGFSIPDNWAFDQFATVTVGTGDGSIEIDKNGFSGRDLGVQALVSVSRVSGVTLNEAAKTLNVNQSFSLIATVSPANATNKDITWTSSDTSVATVSNGNVTAKKVGSAIITVTTADGKKTADCKVTVTQPVTGVSISNVTNNMIVGKTYTLKATVAPSDATNKTVTWQSSNTKVATISNTGKVVGIGSGTVKFTATASGKSKTVTVTVHSYVTLRIGKTKAIRNGVTATIDSQGTKPFKIAGKTMVPIRFVGEKMGGKVSYISDKQPIVMTYGNRRVELRLNSRGMKVTVGDVVSIITLDVAAQKRNGRTYIPLRAIGQALGFTIYYDSATEIIVVNNPSMSIGLRNERVAEGKRVIK